MGTGITLENVSLGYGESPLLRDISAEMPGGKVTVIIGPSGGGKSTLLKSLLGLLPPMSGRILFDGVCPQNMTPEESRCFRQRLGVLFQDGALLGSLTLGENVALPLTEHTTLDAELVEEVVALKLRLVGLEPFMQYYPRQLSGGMRKRAGLARALVLDPDCLMCDEPSSGLDPVNAAELDRLLMDLKATFGMTIVVVTHDLESLFSIADHVLMISGGRLAYQGPPQGLRESEDEFIRHFLHREPVRGRALTGKESRTRIQRDRECPLPANAQAKTGEG